MDSINETLLILRRKYAELEKRFPYGGCKEKHELGKIIRKFTVTQQYSLVKPFLEKNTLNDGS